MKTGFSLFQALLISCLIGIMTLGLLVFSDLNKIQKVNKASFFYKMDHDFFISDSSKALIRAIGNKTPIFKINGGNFDAYNVDDYLAFFEMLKNYWDDGIISEKYLYNMYSYYIIEAYRNKEIQNYIESFRKETNDTTYYKNFENLAIRFIEKSE